MDLAKYNYDQFVTQAKAQGYYPSLSQADIAAARIDPDRGMELLGYAADYDAAMSSGKSSAAMLAQGEMDRIRAGYGDGNVGSFSAGVTPVSPDQYGAKEIARMMKNLAGYDSGSAQDFNSDGTMNAKDVAYAMKKLAGYTDESASKGYGNVPTGNAVAPASTGDKAPAVTPAAPAASAAGSVPAGYKETYDRLLDQYLSGDVDVEGSRLWEAYKKQYLREGDRAAADVLGQIAGANGGKIPSYAMTAASQQENYYRAQLMDRYPELWKILRGEQQDALAAAADALDREKAAALLAAQYGDLSGLKGLGIDTTAYETEQTSEKEKQLALMALQYGDATLFDKIYGTDLTGEMARQKALEEAEMRAKFGDLSGYRDLGYDTSLYEAAQGQSAASDAADKELETAITLAKLGMPEYLAALLGRSTAEVAAEMSTAGTSGSKTGTGRTNNTREKEENDTGTKAAKVSIPDYVTDHIAKLYDEGDYSGLERYIVEMNGLGMIGDVEANAMLATYVPSAFKTRDEAIAAGAPEETFSRAMFDMAKGDHSDQYPWLDEIDTYEEYLAYMVSKGRNGGAV